jgi:hypothetical protein
VEYYLNSPKGKEEAQAIVEHGYQTLTQRCRLDAAVAPLLAQIEIAAEAAAV